MRHCDKCKKRYEKTTRYGYICEECKAKPRKVDKEKAKYSGTPYWQRKGFVTEEA